MRYEISLRTTNQIAPLVSLLHRHTIGAVNLTHFGHSLDAATAVGLLRQSMPELDICLHFSLSQLSPAPSEEDIRRYVKRTREQGISSLLVLSGSPRTAYSSVEGLAHLHTAFPDLPLFVAYNPFSAAQQAENQRLAKKLAAAPLAGIYLQIGDDLPRLQAGIDAVRHLDPAVALLGCLLIPTPKLQENLIRSPWPEVLLSHSYLTDMEQAVAATRNIFRLYMENGVEPLIERLPLTEQSMLEIQELLAPRR